jgi:hypothetical protein
MGPDQHGPPDLRIGIPIQATGEIFVSPPDSISRPNPPHHKVVEEIHAGKEVVYNQTVPPVLEPIHHPINDVVPQAMLATPCALTEVNFHLPDESTLRTGKQPHLYSKSNRFIRHKLRDKAILSFIRNHALVHRDLHVEVVDAFGHLIEHVQQPLGFSNPIDPGICHISSYILLIMDKRLNFVFFQYFNTVGGPPRLDSLTRWPAEWLKIENIY